MTSHLASVSWSAKWSYWPSTLTASLRRLQRPHCRVGGSGSGSEMAMRPTLTPALTIWVSPDRSHDQGSWRKQSICYIPGTIQLFPQLCNGNENPAVHGGHCLMPPWAQHPSQDKPCPPSSHPGMLPPNPHHCWPQDTGWCSRNWRQLALCSFPLHNGAISRGLRKEGAKALQAICGPAQSSHPFHAEACPLEGSLRQPPQGGGNLLCRHCLLQKALP